MFVQRHDFTVEDCRTFQLSQCVHDQWESFPEIFLIAAVQADVTPVVALCNRPESIPLQLYHPAVAVEGIGEEARYHRCDHFGCREKRDSKPV